MASNDSDGDRRPVLGLPTYAERTRFGDWDVPAAVLHHDYVEMVVRAGGIPVLLPPGGVARPELVDRLDGLLLTGGADIEPARYGRPPAALGYTRADRDESEFALFALALAAGLPILAVCRGLQLVNVALGGTLIQHVPDVVGHEQHSGGPGSFGDVRVRTVGGTRVSGLVGAEATVRCHHHQAIDALAPGLVVSARADDGTIEAIERPGEGFLVGVQWHPEADRDDDRLVRGLVAAASGRTGGSGEEWNGW
ncbi:gamma-glutamyl-gamma-aminobutyrate hydrolase family protein [Nocardia puris]|uniref:Putative glutamine amidotransferase n=1 Tax=Nocardia puris TaxID=208602 RepID=A0A366E6H5_9NOCA|nr:gamma-glutamyl-gamma-aminobutyrate hydrolase family protein [Nocardia puris]MBF6214668.1 gamma-glutamyl-gamma-aminobutyrate hydrolase family protein [Nocardia puris]MBF6368858.1 gamma-glutamyl-gamma-aminobutyrate hydrolase family protein [Nocardia puris]MBF6462438.1 gamma-glutamyl-gamma-aminobutyrate hydrolase family protein [Nocardia puris]RBO97018.1 putative glutamine amidotransferase [Nocardia puris]